MSTTILFHLYCVDTNKNINPKHVVFFPIVSCWQCLFTANLPSFRWPYFFWLDGYLCASEGKETVSCDLWTWAIFLLSQIFNASASTSPFFTLLVLAPLHYGPSSLQHYFMFVIKKKSIIQTMFALPLFPLVIPFLDNVTRVKPTFKKKFP